MRFDGPEQRLRLIEVIDFTKNHLKYKDKDVLRPAEPIQSDLAQADYQLGPSFRHVYNRLLGPTFPGEYVEPESEDDKSIGTYVLSYPGIAFSFPLAKADWSPNKDCVSLFPSSPMNQIASSMAIFRGKSWLDARDSLFTYKLDLRDLLPMSNKNRDSIRDEIKLVRIHGEGDIELLRHEGIPHFWIKLGLTSPQDLVANLGPPDAIYRKNDQRMSIHKSPLSINSRLKMKDLKIYDDSTDTDQSSAYTLTDDSDSEGCTGEVAGSVSGEYFYNYFHHGFDILLSHPVTPSPCPPSKISCASKSIRDNIIPSDISSRLVTTKLVLHGNVPGSYAFNRHRRCRWEIQYLNTKKDQKIINSESPFHEVEERLHQEWRSIYKETNEKEIHQRGMVLNRDWGDSLGSSCELLGGWEENLSYKRTDSAEDIRGLGNTTLYGFPGLAFEVMKNGAICGVTVF